MKPSFDKIVKDNSAEMLRRALYLTRDEETAKDLVQEVFIDFWEKQNHLNITSSITSYLLVMLKNKFIKFIAAQNKQASLFTHLSESMISVEQSFIQLLEINEISKSLSEIIDELPSVMKQVYLLRDQDYSIKEIAKILGISEQTVKSYGTESKHRIRQQILLRHPEISSSLLLIISQFLTHR